MRKLLLITFLAMMCLGVGLVLSCGDDDDDDDDSADNDTGEYDDDDLIDNGDGTATDPLSGLTWQVTPPGKRMSLVEANDYCENLSFGGQDDWHIPSISELRSLIRGCDDAVTGGTCGVTDDCFDATCWTDPCNGCGYLAGPGSGGAYWPDGMEGEIYHYWSSSYAPGVEYCGGGICRWRVGFHLGIVDYSLEVDSYNTLVRCVRP